MSENKNIPLRERIAALQGKETQRRIETEQAEQRTTQQLVTEIADSIEGHQRLDVKINEQAKKNDKEAGYGYSEVVIQEEQKLFTERAEVEAQTKELEANRADLAKLEEQLGTDAVADLKTQLQNDERSLQEQQQKLAEDEKKIVELARQQREFGAQAVKRAETPAGQERDIPTFATEAIIQTYKEAGQDFSARADELKQLAQTEVGRRVTEKRLREIAREREERMNGDMAKINEWGKRVTAAVENLGSNMEKDKQLFQKADQIIADIRPKVQQLTSEYEKPKGLLQSKKNKEEHNQQIVQELSKLKSETTNSLDELWRRRDNGAQYQDITKAPDITIIYPVGDHNFVKKLGISYHQAEAEKRKFQRGMKERGENWTGFDIRKDVQIAKTEDAFYKNQETASSYAGIYKAQHEELIKKAAAINKELDGLFKLVPR